MTAVVGDLTPAETRWRMARAGLGIRVGAYTMRLRTALPDLADVVGRLYAAHPLGDPDGFHDIHAAVAPATGPRRWIAPQVRFMRDGDPLFQPQPRAHAPAVLEWGLNWCFSVAIHDHLAMHAAVLARPDGRAIVMPAPPGSGKSTLCAALMGGGWRLLSDELCILRLSDGALLPVPRPLNLKNRSIDIVAARFPDAVFGPRVHGTTKGTIVQMAPPRDAVGRQDEPARPAWIVFPRWTADAGPARTEPLERGHALMRLAENTFNYNILGAAAFEALADMAEGCPACDFTYSDLDDALSALATL